MSHGGFMVVSILFVIVLFFHSWKNWFSSAITGYSGEFYIHYGCVVFFLLPFLGINILKGLYLFISFWQAVSTNRKADKDINCW